MKYKRQNAIMRIVKATPVHTHDELISALVNEGFNVTQATVSRDIKELGLIKIPSPDGASVYSMPHRAVDAATNRIDMVADSVRGVTAALHTIVINTIPGMASAVAAAIDAAMHNDILGSVAGDDTVLVITENEVRAKELAHEMKNIFKTE